MDRSDRDIYRWLHGVTTAASAMPEIALLPGERMALAGHLFQGAEAFVRAVAKALGDAPALYRDIPVDAALLLQRQDRAQALLKLQAALELYARRAADWYLLEQSTAVQEAQSVIRQVRAEALRPYPHPDRERRAEELAPAERILAERQARKRSGKGRPQQQRGAAQRRAAADYARALREREAARLEEAMTPAGARADAPTAPVSELHVPEAEPEVSKKSAAAAWPMPALLTILLAFGAGPGGPRQGG